MGAIRDSYPFFSPLQLRDQEERDIAPIAQFRPESRQGCRAADWSRTANGSNRAHYKAWRPDNVSLEIRGNRVG